MFCFHDKVKKQPMDDGTIRKDFPHGQNVNILHSILEDKAEVESNTHPEEQLGYIIRGSLEVIIGEEKAVLKAGDVYIVPPNVPHAFVSIGETEAIDVFAPVHKFWSLE